jgi:hypothetical protein
MHRVLKYWLEVIEIPGYFIETKIFGDTIHAPGA